MPVVPGVWWVEIPEVELRILCGAPMDSIKHLMRRGLVKKIEKDGVVFEIGPNAILLSDVAIQSGRFWNLAEFPVLHMLYRQGMVIPGHPGNTGSKPILTGLEERAEAVLGYIYRGTYGLATREEMTEAGIPAKDLDELWRLKLKFAGGDIKSPHDLVDVKTVNDGEVSLPGGVKLIRDSENIYTFSYKGKSLQVDMNLPAGEDWSASYTLNHVDVDDGYFSVIHIGEGNGWDPEKPCMGSIVTYRGHKYLIDAGPGIDYSLQALGIDVSEIEGLFITHAHDDHFAGLTSLLRGDRKVNVYATKPVTATVRFKCAALLEREPDFLDHLVNINYLEEDVWNDIDGLEVRPTMSPHPLETTIMFFRALWEGGYKSYAHLADIISETVLNKFISPDGISEKFRDRVFAEYHRKADIKKIDAGRGLIHGFAEDFIDDPSERLILSHIEGNLSPGEKEIGASVAFGQVDILIPDRGDRLRDISATLLDRTVPGIPRGDYNLLLNGKVQRIMPGTPIVKKGSIPENLMLIITGTVDALDNGDIPSVRYAAGSLIGEEEFLKREPSKCCYRSRNYVKALRIPADIYVHALSKAGKIEKRVEVLDGRRFLVSGKFPGHVVSCPRLDELAAVIKEKTWKSGRRIKSGKDELYIIKSGSVLESGSNGDRLIGEGEWINLQTVLPFAGHAASLTWLVKTSARVVVLPGQFVREIPVLGWTLAESRLSIDG